MDMDKTRGEVFDSMRNKNEAPEASEGRMTRAVESQTAKVPSLGYLGLAAGSMAASLMGAFFFRRKELANFVGLWVPTILIMGLYNKMVKIESKLERQGSF